MWLLAAGYAVQGYANYRAAKAQQAALADQADAYRLQSLQILEKAAAQEKETKIEVKGLTSSQTAAYAKSGVDVSIGAPVQTYEATNAKMMRQAIQNRKEAEYQAKMARRSADLASQQAKEAGTAATLGFLGSLAMAGGEASSK